MKRIDADGRDITDLPGLWGDDDRVIYTPDEAMGMLPAGDGDVTVYGAVDTKSGIYIMAADWSRDAIEEMVVASDEIRLGDPKNKGKGQGLSILYKGYWWFVEAAAPPQLGSPGEAEVANATLLD